ncbi:MAG: hypothetical protein K2J09_00250, partial [Muribaculaceae bacterium]|nr:hypothetical protein [Muribaculaceae bacterium]
VEETGREKVFSDSELPADDSGWEFKEIQTVSPASGKELTLLDRTLGEDMTDSIIGEGCDETDRMLLLLPFPSEAGAAGSYTANELQAAMEQRFGAGAFVAITAGDDTGAVDRALDVMMATFPVYYADRKAIMAVARGSMAVVYLRNGIVVWKRSLSSINLDRLNDGDLAEVYATDGARWFRLLTAIFLLGNLIIYLIGLIPGLFRRKN